MKNDVTVSKLSKLQKRILLYTRQRMLAQGQTIKPRGSVDVYANAPPWLDEALTKSLGKIFEVRKKHFGALAEGRTNLLNMHPWVRFFDEIAFAEQAIWTAAETAGDKNKHSLTQLYKYVMPQFLFIAFHCGYEPWPSHGGGCWYFTVRINETPAPSVEKVKDKIAGLIGEEEAKKYLVSDWPSIPINCTIPEMLRDLFAFPVNDGGHIAALAFSPEQIGAARYNTAQASLRRACSRLGERGLVGRRDGQRRGTEVDIYFRSGIGLTEAGIAAADALAQSRPGGAVMMTDAAE